MNVPRAKKVIPLSTLAKAFSGLADRLREKSIADCQPYLKRRLQQLMTALRSHIPGLDPPIDARAAERILEQGSEILARGQEPERVLRLALQGLSFAPQHPGLFHLTASAAFELGLIELAIRLLQHTLWINPGYQAARADVQALAAFIDEQERDDG